ncbi:MAG: ankyrin repeat domain-containing protein [Micavibrio sp.]|nr:ankyrin repeat domain-containing protein [Micavibrio sp.]
MALTAKGRMFAAVERGDINRVRRMLDNGYNPDEAKWSGKCALLLAVIHNKPEIAELLIERGATFSGYYYHSEFGDTRHETLLHIAAELGHKDIVKLLIAHDRYDRSFIDKPDTNRNSALHLAAARGHGEIAEMLVDYGFDPALKGANGKLPIGYAHQGKHEAVVDLLTVLQKRVALLKNPPRQLEPVPAQKPASDSWKLVNTQSVAHLSAMDDLGYKITDVFNFASRERIRIVNNLKTRADNVETTSFDELRDGAQLQEAYQKLIALGGTADEPAAKKPPRLGPPNNPPAAKGA